MQPLSPPSRYDSVAMTLHWVIAVLLLLDFAFAMVFLCLARLVTERFTRAMCLSSPYDQGSICLTRK